MLLLPLAVLLSVLGVLGAQMPTVDGVIGGVPSSRADTLFGIQVLADAPANTTTSANSIVTPGTLRVVENSGICGKSC